MKICTKCGGQMNNDDKFCTHCGEKNYNLTQNETSQITKPYYQQIETNPKFTSTETQPHGYPQQSQGYPPQPQPQPQPQSQMAFSYQQINNQIQNQNGYNPEKQTFGGNNPLEQRVMPPKPEVLQKQIINVSNKHQTNNQYIPQINVDYTISCPNCGTLLMDNPEHCPNCGKRFSYKSKPIIRPIDKLNNFVNILNNNTQAENMYDADNDGVADIEQRENLIKNIRNNKKQTL